MKPAYPVEVRHPAWSMWTWLAMGLGCLAGGVALWLSEMRYAVGVIALLLFAAGCFYAFLEARVERWRLHADRIEKVGLLRTVVQPLREITGLRPLNGVTLVVPGKRWPMTIPVRVFRNPHWLAWVQTVPNLEYEHQIAALDAAEQDKALGDSVPERQRSLRFRRRAMLAASLASMALFLWTVTLPKPYPLPVVLGAALPLCCIGLIRARPDVFSWRIMAVAARVSLAMWLLPLIAIAVVAMHVDLIDWLPPLILAAPLALGLTALAMWSEPEARTRLAAAGFGLCFLAGSWGGAVLLNAWRAAGPPVVMSAEVIGTGGTKDEPTIDLRVGGDRPFTVRNMDVPPAAITHIEAGRPVCVTVITGLLGWRTALPRPCAPSITPDPQTRDGR